MIRTRFAPSPTGYLHIGGLRTALYAYLLAKHHNGKFYIRIEDTDQTRLVEDAEKSLLEVIENMGVIPDESILNPWDFGPYRQSDRLDIYQDHIKKILDSWHAYHCFCTPERLSKLRKNQEELGLTPRYDGCCRNLTPDEVKEKIQSGLPYTIRLKVPKNKKITFRDYLRWNVTVPSNDVDDQVLMKTDGFPTYHLAAAIDDHLMQTSHIIRGEEWIASAPKLILIYEAFGWTPPELVHVPVILGNDRKKLSKRTGDTNILVYLEKGFLKEALINYIALLGWNPKTTEEFFTMEELISRFSLEGINKSAAIFDIEKLTWMNGQYIMKMETEKLYPILEKYLQEYEQDFYKNIFSKAEKKYNLSILKELQPRLSTLKDFPELTQFFYEDISVNTELFLHEKMKIKTLEDAKNSLLLWQEILKDLPENISQEELKNIFLEKIKEAEMKNGQVLWPMRVALTGEKFSPGVFEMIGILGMKTSRERISKSLELL